MPAKSNLRRVVPVTLGLVAWATIGAVVAERGQVRAVAMRAEITGLVSATAMMDGNIFFLGGNGGRIFLPRQAKWLRVADGSQPRTVLHSANLLPNGSILVTGGLSLTEDCKTLSTIRLYEPSIGRWRLLGSMLHRRMGHTATILKDNELLVVGGLEKSCDSGANEVDQESAELCRVDTGSCIELRSPGMARSFHASAKLDEDSLLVIGGRSVMGHSAGTLPPQVYKRSQNTWIWTECSQLPGDFGNDGVTATAVGNDRVLVIGSVSGTHNRSPAVSDYHPGQAGLFDKKLYSWRMLNSPPLPTGWHTATALAGGKVVVIGGRMIIRHHPFPISVQSDSILLFDSANESWLKAGNLPQPRSHHTATALPGGGLLVAGGECGNTTHCTDVLRLTFEAPVTIHDK